MLESEVDFTRYKPTILKDLIEGFETSLNIKNLEYSRED